jgi:hypothetical protein
VFDVNRSRSLWLETDFSTCPDNLAMLFLAVRKYFVPIADILVYFQVFDMEPNPFVIFDPINKWEYGKTQTFHYTIRCGIEPDSSPWDFIGLYKVKHAMKFYFYLAKCCKVRSNVTLIPTCFDRERIKYLN